jgi:hypothetical protein
VGGSRVVSETVEGGITKVEDFLVSRKSAVKRLVEEGSLFIPVGDKGRIKFKILQFFLAFHVAVRPLP